jgi:hypothetical protein
MFPDTPSAKNDQGVQPFTRVARSSRFHIFPPNVEGCFSWRRGKLGEANLMEKGGPDLPSNHAPNEQVLDVLFLLITQDTFV